MIDSLYLDFGHDFAVAKDSLLVVQRDTTAGIGEHSVRDFGLWADSTEGVVSGRRAYFRRTGMLRFDVDIKVWKDGKRHCLVKFSVPELLYGTNDRPAPVNELPAALDALATGLRQIGIHTDVRRAMIVRIDLARQAGMVDEFSSYARVFRRIHVPSTDLMERNSTVLWLHRQKLWAINAYDKSVQSGAVTQGQHGVLRMEVQLRNRRTVERVLGYSTVEGLLRSGSTLSDAYRDFLEKRLLIDALIRGGARGGRDIDRLQQLLAHHREKGGDRWRSEALERIGLAFMCREIGVDSTVELLAPAGPGASSTERSRHSRVLAKARSAVLDLGLPDDLGDPAKAMHTRLLENIRDIMDGRIM